VFPHGWESKRGTRANLYRREKVGVRTDVALPVPIRTTIILIIHILTLLVSTVFVFVLILASNSGFRVVIVAQVVIMGSTTIAHADGRKLESQGWRVERASG
jgi:hypothetical protein